MKLKEVVSQKKALCEKCPFTLGLIQTVANSCLKCRMNKERDRQS